MLELLMSSARELARLYRRVSRVSCCVVAARGAMRAHERVVSRTAQRRARRERLNIVDEQVGDNINATLMLQSARADNSGPLVARRVNGGRRQAPRRRRNGPPRKDAPPCTRGLDAAAAPRRGRGCLPRLVPTARRPADEAADARSGRCTSRTPQGALPRRCHDGNKGATKRHEAWTQSAGRCLRTQPVDIFCRPV